MRPHLLLVALLSLLSPLLQAESPQGVESLYQLHCVSCHGSEVMTRENRRVNSLDQLHSQVRKCDSALNLKLFEEDLQAVATYLNDQYYHFKTAD